MQKMSVFVLVAALMMGGCGGGTSGTGLSSLSGSVRTADDRPLVGAKVTVEQTGDSVTTDDSGEFEITTDAADPEIRLRVEAEEIDTTVTVKKNEEEESRSSVQVRINEANEATLVEQFDLNAMVVGPCRHFFENGVVIRQSKPLKARSCTIRAIVYGDGFRRPSIEVAVQYRGCNGTPPKQGAWKTLATGVTEEGENIGTAEFAFRFEDSEPYCEYRIVAPYHLDERTPLFYPLHSLSYQRLFPADE